MSNPVPPEPVVLRFAIEPLEILIETLGVDLPALVVEGLVRDLVHRLAGWLGMNGCPEGGGIKWIWLRRLESSCGLRGANPS